MFSSCYSKKYCIFVEKRLHLSNRSKLHSVRFALFLHVGSNALGMHHAGAARVAYNEFGAEWGNGEGLQGQSYSIPTMEGEHNTKLAIMRFTQYAREHPELKFLVTPVGCGIAGYTPEEIAPMFKDAAYLENVYLPISFWKVLMI